MARRTRGPVPAAGGGTRQPFPRGPIPASAKAGGQAGVYKNDKTSVFGNLSKKDGGMGSTKS